MVQDISAKTDSEHVFDKGVKSDSWHYVTAAIVSGYGVASGLAKDSPYPQGSIEMQAPLFKERGMDLSGCYLGTLNVSVAPKIFELHDPEMTIRNLAWTDLIEPEDFSFSPCRIMAENADVHGWIYFPRPETKTRHFQSPSTVEVIAPHMDLKIGDQVTFAFLKSQARIHDSVDEVKHPQKGVLPSSMSSSKTRAESFRGSLLAICALMLGALFLGACTVTNITGSNLSKNPERRIEVGLQAANEYLKVNDIDNALRHVKAVLKLDERNSAALQTMALIHTKEGNLETAQEFYKRAIRYDKNASSARNNYATLLYSLGRYEEAIDQLKVAAADLSYDNRAQAMQNLGLAYVAQGRLFEAEASFQNALRLNPELAQSLLELTDLLMQKEQYNLAARYLKDYAKVARHTARSLWLGIQIERVLGNGDALASYELALRNLYPKSPEYRRYMETRNDDQ